MKPASKPGSRRGSLDPGAKEDGATEVIFMIIQGFFSGNEEDYEMTTVNFRKWLSLGGASTFNVFLSFLFFFCSTQLFSCVAEIA